MPKKQKDDQKIQKQRFAEFYVNARLPGVTKKPTKINKDNVKNFECLISVNNKGERIFNASINDRVIIQRYDSSTETKKTFNEGIITELNDDGSVLWFDCVRGQWFLFNWKSKNVPLIIAKKR
jgi:hypothetical protein